MTTIFFLYIRSNLVSISESNSMSPQFFGGTANVTQKGRPRKQRKPIINQQQNEPLDLGTAMRMGKSSRVISFARLKPKIRDVKEQILSPGRTTIISFFSFLCYVRT